MATKAQWEVDPETRSKLATIQKKEGMGNDKCCDCGAPSPQWASPKFSTFICLTCAGLHRGLGVHVSFVRSISMDAFKQAEISRMQNGGNKKWQDFFTQNSATTFEEATIKERYDCEVGEEWKERLSALVEEREFDKDKWRTEREEVLRKQREKRESTPMGRGSNTASRTGSPAPSKLGQPQLQTQGKGITPEQKAQNEAYFARMGERNANRADDLPPSQGGKYAGFGSQPAGEQVQDAPGVMPSADEFSKDPVAALTKGFGWFGGVVSKQAKLVNDSYLQPAAKNIASTDFAAQARNAAVAAGQGIQTGAKGAADGFNKFIEGQDEGASAAANRKKVEPERKDFWDSFGAAKEEEKPSNLGTGVLKKITSNTGTVSKRNKEDGWGEDW